MTDVRFTLGGRHEFGKVNGGSCCKDCPDRHIGCHDTCEIYQASKAEYLENKAKIRNAKKQAKDFDVYKIGVIEKTRKERKYSKYTKGDSWRT